MQNYITLDLSDGTQMACYTALPPGKLKKVSALILVQEAYGVNHHIRDVANRFASEGYLVVAPEIYHRTAPAYFEAPYNDFSAVIPHFQAVTIDTLTIDLKGVYDWLNAHDGVTAGEVFSVGYCLGGRVAFVANALLPLKASISYYGGGIASLLNMATQLHGKHLFFWEVWTSISLPTRWLTPLRQWRRRANLLLTLNFHTLIMPSFVMPGQATTRPLRRNHGRSL